ncbi:hypothetical protein BDN70DRAFT_340803 [Pholiota conissans]|uniref:DUF7223 domain-containing protein n=1 Tax=Pholiota conissans TaxID=109636 RepID=A0A9P6CW10_9AGAR|nr:hypothetical protein BDN70DRAFT_340803 [Pholiota conissans]
MLSPLFYLTPFFVSSALAANDWSTPCLSGVCEYDLPTNTSASGTIKIWSSDASAISDVTTAAGWTILGCAPDTLEQNIRLVCTGSSTDCVHLYSNSTTGAVGKVVRLPEACGKGPFAVVTKMYKSPDQTLPASLSRRAVGMNSTVQGLSISAKFSSVNAPSTAPVNFAIRAANVPGAGGDLGAAAQVQRRGNSRVFRFARGITDFIDSAIDDISSLDDFNVNKSTTLQPFDIDKSFNLVDQKISCPPVDASVKIDVDAKAHAVASIGVAASGTILPPKVESFAVIAGLNAEIDGSVTMAADASGSLDSGKIPLFEVGIPGLDIPGILTIGPSFKVDAQATAKLDVNADVTVGLSYTINNAQLVFPPSSSSSQNKGAFNIGDTPLKLSASPSASASGTLEAHLIPSLNLGISALEDTVSATIFLELDASAAMTLSAQADASASATVGRRALRYWRNLEDVRARQFDDAEDGDGDEAFPSDDSTTGATNASTHDPDIDTTQPSLDDGDSGNSDSSFDDSAATDSTDGDVDASKSDNTSGGDDSDPEISPTDAGDDSAVTDGSSDSSDDADSAVDDTNEGNLADGTPNSDADTSSATTDPSTDPTSTDSSTDTTSTAADASVTAPSSKTLAVSTQTSASFGGCLEVDATLDVNAGASGSFFGLFDKSTKVDLFNKKFEVLKKCFGSEAAKRSLPRRRLLSILPHGRATSISLPQRRAFALQCPSTSENTGEAQQNLVDETVAASSIQ